MVGGLTVAAGPKIIINNNYDLNGHSSSSAENVGQHSTAELTATLSTKNWVGNGYYEQKNNKRILGFNSETQRGSIRKTHENQVLISHNVFLGSNSSKINTGIYIYIVSITLARP